MQMFIKIYTTTHKISPYFKFTYWEHAQNLPSKSTTTIGQDCLDNNLTPLK